MTTSLVTKVRYSIEKTKIGIQKAKGKAIEELIEGRQPDIVPTNGIRDTAQNLPKCNADFANAANAANAATPVTAFMTQFKEIIENDIHSFNVKHENDDHWVPSSGMNAQLINDVIKMAEAGDPNITDEVIKALEYVENHPQPFGLNDKTYTSINDPVYESITPKGAEFCAPADPSILKI